VGRAICQSFHTAYSQLNYLPYLVDDLQVVGNKLYTVGGEGELRQYDITTADSPVELTCTELGEEWLPFR
jgi:hypothetical protein